MLIASEAFEAFAAYRNGKDDEIPEELADIVIRVMDVCEAKSIDLELEIMKKHYKNQARPYRHGGKRC